MSRTVSIVDKPWGHEEIWAHTDKYVGKLLYIKDGHRLSLQYHNFKEETMRVLTGILTFVLNGETHTLYPGQVMHVLPGEVHRMEARHGDVTVLECSTPELSDVVRVEDDYSR